MVEPASWKLSWNKEPEVFQKPLVPFCISTQNTGFAMGTSVPMCWFTRGACFTTPRV